MLLFRTMSPSHYSSPQTEYSRLSHSLAYITLLTALTHQSAPPDIFHLPCVPCIFRTDKFYYKLKPFVTREVRSMICLFYSLKLSLSCVTCTQIPGQVFTGQRIDNFRRIILFLFLLMYCVCYEYNTIKTLLIHICTIVYNKVYYIYP